MRISAGNLFRKRHLSWTGIRIPVRVRARRRCLNRCFRASRARSYALQYSLLTMAVILPYDHARNAGGWYRRAQAQLYRTQGQFLQKIVNVVMGSFAHLQRKRGVRGRYSVSTANGMTISTNCARSSIRRAMLQECSQKAELLMK